MDKFTLKHGSSSLLVLQTEFASFIAIGDGKKLNSFSLDNSQLDELTNYLIELRGARRVQALLEQP